MYVSLFRGANLVCQRLIELCQNSSLREKTSLEQMVRFFAALIKLKTGYAVKPCKLNLLNLAFIV